MTEAAADETAGRLSDGRPRDFYFAFGLAALAALLNTCALASEMSRAAGFRTLTSPAVPLLLLVIELGLLANVLGLWLRKASGLLTSLSALLTVGVGYLVWFVYSRQTLGLLSSKPFYQLHAEALPAQPFGLLGATWMSAAVLLLSGVLAIWEIKTLYAVFGKRPRAART